MEHKRDTNEDIRCVILGGGGHASVLIDSLIASALATPYAVLDPDRSRWGRDVLGVPILGDDDLLSEMVNRGVNCFAVGLGATGDNRPRQRLFEMGLFHNLEPLTVIHPKAICSGAAKI